MMQPYGAAHTMYAQQFIADIAHASTRAEKSHRVSHNGNTDQNTMCPVRALTSFIALPANDAKNSTSARLNAGSWTDSKITSTKFPRP